MKTDKDFTFNSSEYHNFLDSLSEKGPASTGLITFIGPYMPDKNKAVKELAKKLNREIVARNFSDLVMKSEEKTKANFTEAFAEADPGRHLLFFSNGADLCGNYTGNTFSKVKYATPEERHFLNLAEKFDGLVLVTIRSDDAADQAIKRLSEKIIRFPLPDSPLKRFSWKLRNYTFHGFKLPDERTEIT